MATLRELRDSRIEKLNKIREKGIDPYPAKSFRSISNIEVHNRFDKLEGKEVIVSGRALAVREHGQLAFIDIKDSTGTIQLYLKPENIKNVDYSKSELDFSDIHLLDSGDFVEGKGIITKTKRGEISVEVSELRILTKSIRPMPSAWDGLSDKEVRLRRRYLDLNVNEEVFQRFLRKTKFWEATREFMNKRGFLEFHTPILEQVPGGADARPFVTHHNDLNQDFYLRISPELYLKRIIGGGYEKVYSIGPNFRNEGMSDEHLAEFNNIEWYWAYADYRDNMILVRDLIRHTAQEVYGKTTFEKNGLKFDLMDEWKEIDYVAIIKETFGIDIFESTDEEMMKALKDNNVKLSGTINRNRMIDNLWKVIRKTLAGPAFLVNEPKFMSPLAKSKADEPRLTERFHVVIAGSENGNGYSELNDPLDQLDRFAEQQAQKDAGDDEAQMLDIDFVEMLEYGMPPTSGYAHGERLFWFFEDVSAREGTMFPQMKHEIDEVTKGIYPEIFKKNEIKKTENTIEVVQDFSKKIVVVVNGELPNWQITNAIGHVSAYIGNQLKDSFGTGENFRTKDNKNHPRNTQFPIVVLSAKPGQMTNLLDKVRESGLLYHDFIREMIETSDDKKISDILADKHDSEIELLAIGFFGKNEDVDKLTKKFSLFK